VIIYDCFAANLDKYQGHFLFQINVTKLNKHQFCCVKVIIKRKDMKTVKELLMAYLENIGNPDIPAQAFTLLYEILIISGK
jgi:hypothetical protein